VNDAEFKYFVKLRYFEFLSQKDYITTDNITLVENVFSKYISLNFFAKSYYNLRFLLSKIRNKIGGVDKSRTVK
jgi:hypothetical protein